MSKMNIPKALAKLAVSRRVNLLREYDSTGKHVCYTLRLANGQVAHRQSVAGITRLIRFLYPVAYCE